MKTILLIIQILTLYKLFTMANKLANIGAALDAAKETLNKVSGETTSLHTEIVALKDQIAALNADAVSQEEIDALQAKAEEVAAAAKAVDNLTTDAVAELPETPADPVEDAPVEGEENA